MRVTSRVPPEWVGVNCQVQVLSGLVQSNHLLISNECTLSAVRSVGGDADIGTHCPIASAWNCGMIVVALGRARLSRRSLLYQPARRQPTCTSHGQTASGEALMSMALVDRKLTRG